MNCEKYMSLTDQEQRQYIGELVHAAMSCNICFDVGNELIQLAQAKGKFEGVKIGIEDIYQDGTNDDLG